MFRKRHTETGGGVRDLRVSLVLRAMVGSKDRLRVGFVEGWFESLWSS